jgi:hypothetical protein
MTIVDLKPMKNKAMQFPEPLKSLILSESASMDSDEFIAKLGTWDKLLKMTTAEVNKK